MPDPTDLEKKPEAGFFPPLLEGGKESSFSRLGELMIEPYGALREHQIDALQNIIEFFRKGEEIGYVDLPTGTGKTVLFVEICRQLALAEKTGVKTGKSIILVPNLDLVKQTVGSVDAVTGKKRGFKGFAPDLDVRPIYGKIRTQDRIESLRADVLVTTYDSFRNIIDTIAKLGDVDPTELRERAKEHNAVAESLMTERDRLIEERQRQFFPIFQQNSLKIVRKRLSRMMAIINGLDADNDIEPESTEGEYENFNQVDTIQATSETNQDNLKRQLLEPFREQIEELHGIAFLDLPTSEIITKLLSKTRRLEPKIKKAIAENETIVNEVTPGTGLPDDEYIHHSKLDPFSALIQSFNRKFKHRRRLSRADFESYRVSEKWSEIDEKLIDLRNRATYARSLAHQCEYQATMQESMQGYELLVCDEAHRAVGENTWDAIKEYAMRHDISVLGLTATDKFFDRTLVDYFGNRIHSLSRLEAMEMGLISPLAMFIHNTDITFDDIDLDASGDYDPSTMKGVSLNPVRNRAATEYASMLTAAGISGIISTNPGNEGEHARIMHELLNNTLTIDAVTGEERYIRAQYVLGRMDGDERAKYYAQFERGELDWLVFVDVLREGWDSDRAKALINLLSTRSPVLATQRLGRIGRVDEQNPLSIVIDFYDDFHRRGSVLSIPPVLATDVFHVDRVRQGHVIGTLFSEIPNVVDDLARRMTGELRAHHIEFMKQYESALPLDSSGRSVNTSDGERWMNEAALDLAFEGFMPLRVLRDAMKEKIRIRTRLGRNSTGRVMELFNGTDISLLHLDKPEINPWKLVVDADGTKWLTPNACVKLLEKLHVSLEDVKYAIEKVEEEGIEYRVARVNLGFDNNTNRFGLVQLYRMSDVLNRVVPVLKNHH